MDALNRARSRDVEAIDRALMKAKVHINFVISLYREQMDGGRYFMHEHPLQASSWAMPAMQALWEIPEVQRAHGDQCM